MNSQTPSIALCIDAVLETSSRKYNKAVAKLPQHIQSQYVSVIGELISGTLRPGRRLEKLVNFDNVYSVRLNREYRLVFEYIADEKAARPVSIGPHDEAYRRS